jgi:signal transduction histidine kinase
VADVDVTALSVSFGGQPAKLIIIEDRTRDHLAERERAQLQDRLNRAQKMEALGLLAGGVAHDLNNILSGIYSYPQLLLTDLPADSEWREALETIARSGERAAAVVQDLLTITRGVAVKREPHDLDELVSLYLSSPEYRVLANDHPTVRMQVEAAQGPVVVNGSPHHLRKALMNLVTNAFEAVGESGTVAVRTRREDVTTLLEVTMPVRPGRYGVLEVEDSGPGIGEADLQRVFEPFYSKKYLGRSGTGLGLAVVWNTVQDHGGGLQVATSAEGTRFVLYFPSAVAGADVPSRRLTPEDLSGRGETVLVVDDEPAQREIACRMLRRLGYRAEAVPSGEEAVARFPERPADVLLLDMIMAPGIDGGETYERVVAATPGQKAVLVSGFAESADVRKAQQLGAGPFLRKPYSLEELGLVMLQVLGRPVPGAS